MLADIVSVFDPRSNSSDKMLKGKTGLNGEQRERRFCADCSLDKTKPQRYMRVPVPWSTGSAGSAAFIAMNSRREQVLETVFGMIDTVVTQKVSNAASTRDDRRPSQKQLRQFLVFILRMVS